MARYLGWKPNRLRLALVASSLLLAGFPALLYLYAAMAVPADDSG
jgi:phage shock protein PspC (stress-responsive transcriptional regulator)